ncbi:hypothetical protein DLAC_11525 [Tieghemostelium lacteum]|uniref:Isopentenyl phosphate kinase n=1 Tax=Tieghemostelium lacteum TaxID=361077 RepID=A0A152A2S0_TIELA|nr:hypothetical protein DLAC_11525 [Tieghemostelium lacteum]|eukprot:KYR00538.1 hypothetical protein DLAC_11525 [Tieghemostelium lacteum]
MNKLIIIKCGGAYISVKEKHETVDEKHMNNLVELIVRLRKNGYRICLIIGAGSFGHFEAKEYSVNKGLQNDSKVQLTMGIAKTRSSVTKLLYMVVSKLINSGIEAVALSPFGSWLTDKDRVVYSNIDLIRQCLNGTSSSSPDSQCSIHSIVPVLHGDVCMDITKGCGIISGDLIINYLSQQLNPEKCVFISDVEGFYNKSPKLHQEAKLIPLILCKKDQGSQIAAETSDKLDHDVTGGMKSKYDSAYEIASVYLIPVFICGGNSSLSLIESCCTCTLNSPKTNPINNSTLFYPLL